MKLYAAIRAFLVPILPLDYFRAHVALLPFGFCVYFLYFIVRDVYFRRWGWGQIISCQNHICVCKLITPVIQWFIRNVSMLPPLTLFLANISVQYCFSSVHGIWLFQISSPCCYSYIAFLFIYACTFTTLIRHLRRIRLLFLNRSTTTSN